MRFLSRIHTKRYGILILSGGADLFQTGSVSASVMVSIRSSVCVPTTAKDPSEPTPSLKASVLSCPVLLPAVMFTVGMLTQSVCSLH